MDIKLEYQPDSAIARVLLDKDEKIYTQAGAMIAMEKNIRPSATLRQGKAPSEGVADNILRALKRTLVGQSLLLHEFHSLGGQGEVVLAPNCLIGDLMTYELSGEELVVHAGSYLASSETVALDIGVQGLLKSAIVKGSIFWLSLSGYGTTILTSFGGIYEIAVDGTYIVNPDHIVAFEKTLNFELAYPGGWRTAFLLGAKALVCRFEGKGKIYCQTHNKDAFGKLIGPKLPSRSS